MAGPDLFDILLRVHGAEELGREYVFVRLARMNIAGHLDYSELSRILQQIRRRADWVDVWMAASERHRALAAAAAYRHAFQSAGDAYLRASLCAHWASLYAPESNKTAAHQTSLELYVTGAPWFEPPAERVEVPFRGDVLPGYVRRIGDASSQPVVIMLGGADTNKEELHHWGTEFARRGMVVLTVDGPGQGELASRYERLTMRFDRYHEAVSAILDWLHGGGVSGVDIGRIGLFGNSLGGYLALDSTLRDQRISAAISNGGFCDAALIDTWPAGVFKAFASCLGLDDEVEIRSHIENHLDLNQIPSNHHPPTLVVHGGREDLADEDESRRAAQAVDGTLLIVEDGWHTCTNRDHVVSPVFADWMRSALEREVRRGFTEIRIKDELGYQGLFEISGQ